VTRAHLKTVENVGYVLVCALLALAFAAARLGWPSWVAQAAVACVFLIGLPTMMLTIRREWRGS
jgi:hypothetical protein